MMRADREVTVMNRLMAVVALGALWPAAAIGQTCGPTQQTIGWSQPNKVPISDDNAVRWPTDGSFRVAYSGPWCPDDSQIELVKIAEDGSNGEVIPSQVRIYTPFTLVTNAPEALTLLEIDPEPELEARADYRILVRPPDPALVANEEFVIELRTQGGPAGAFPDFEGVRNVELDGPVCGETGSLQRADNNNPACPVPNLLRLLVSFQPIDRADVAYIIYRVSSTPLDDAGAPIEDMADSTPIPLEFQNGARDLFGTGVPLRQVRVPVPYHPLPRVDCFSVRALDEYGRERRGSDAEACITLNRIHGEDCPLDQCTEMQCMGIPEPNPFEAGAPVPGQMCDNIGLGGGDPDRPIPPVGEEPDAMVPDAGLPDGGPDGDGGVGAEEGGSGGGGGGAGPLGCRVDLGLGGSAPWPLLLLLLPALRRRRHPEG